MATAPANMDNAAQKMADSVMGKIKPAIDSHINQRLGETQDVNKLWSRGSGKVIDLWSRIPEGHPYTPPQEKGDLGIRAARVVRSFAACKFRANDVPQHLQDRLRDKHTSRIVEKALSTATPSGGGALILDEFLANEIYPLLRDHVSIYSLGARVIPMPKGTLSIAGFDSGTSVGWIGEAASARASKPLFGRVKLSAKKAFGQVIISNDLLEESDYAIDEMVRADLVEALTEVLMTAAVHGTGTEHSPRGIALDERRTQVSVGAVIDQDTATKFVLALKQAKVPFDFNSAGWLFNSAVWAAFYSLKTSTGAWIFRDEMNEGKLLGYPFKVSESVQIGSDGHGLTHICFGKWSEFIVGVTREIMMEESREATIGLDESGNPVNLWDLDCTAVRLTHKLDFGMRLGKAMAHSNNVYTIA